MDFTVPHIEKLAELLREPEPDILQGDDLTSTKYEITETRNNNVALASSQKLPTNIEEYEEQQAKEAEQMSKVGCGAGDRKTPVYTMNYRQSVSAEDVFLQLSAGRRLHSDESIVPTKETSSCIYQLFPRVSINQRIILDKKGGTVISTVLRILMGPKTPSSASCENLIVRVSMPGDKKENIDLSVDTISVTVDSSQYHLKLSLPHEINPDTSNASWDPIEEILLLTLKLQREFDFVNF